jgi:hypothetical protein
MIRSAPPHQLALSGQTVREFGRDRRGHIPYTFNELGWRSEHAYTPNDSAWIFIGNSVTFGMGLTQEKRFSDLLARDLKITAYNFSIAHLIHSNMEYLRIIESILAVSNPAHWVIQVNNLDRLEIDGRWVHVENTAKYHDLIRAQFDYFWSRINSWIDPKKLTLLYWDAVPWTWLPQDFVDRVGKPIPVLDCTYRELPETFGEKTHRLIYTALRRKYQ